MANFIKNNRRHTRTDSDLEAFSHIQQSGGFEKIISQLISFTKYVNEVFLSYYLRFLLKKINRVKLTCLTTV